jgi:hypothetical protein
MRKFYAPMKALLFTVLLALSLAHIHAQATPAPDALFQTIRSLDAKLFDAYNHCDLEKFGALLADDLEFYHDKGGLSIGRQALVDGVKNNICGKVTRELVPGTLEVYPIANYGAVEIGVHRFHHPGHETTESIGEAKFIHLWQNKDGVWKVTRVISFDHHAFSKVTGPFPERRATAIHRLLGKTGGSAPETCKNHLHA